MGRLEGKWNVELVSNNSTMTYIELPVAKWLIPNNYHKPTIVCNPMIL